MPFFSALFYAARYTKGIAESSFLGINLGQQSMILIVVVGVLYYVQSLLSLVGLDEEQKEQISLGLKDNLNVFIYANSEFNWKQMAQIRLGLKNNLDVSIYAKPEILWGQMEGIRLNLLEKKALKIIFSSEIYEVK